MKDNKNVVVSFDEFLNENFYDDNYSTPKPPEKSIDPYMGNAMSRIDKLERQVNELYGVIDMINDRFDPPYPTSYDHE